MCAADYTRPALDFILVHEIVDELLDYLLPLLVFIAVYQDFRVFILIGEMDEVEAGVLAVDVMHNAVDFVHFCSELHAHDFGFALFSGDNFGGLLFYVVGCKFISRDVVDLALGDPLGEYVGGVVYESGGEGVEVDFSWKVLNFDVHTIIKLVEPIENANNNAIL